MTTTTTKPTRRDQILDTATRLFAENGYDGTSMSDLAAGVGLRKASLFHHFSSKEQLKSAVLSRLIHDVGAAIMSASATDLPIGERLDALTDAIVSTLSARPFAARLVVREAMDWSRVAEHGSGEAFQEVFGVLAHAVSFIEAGQTAGVFVEGDARQLVLSLVGLHFLPFALTGVVTRLTGNSPSDAEFADARSHAMRAHVRGMLLKR